MGPLLGPTAITATLLLLLESVSELLQQESILVDFCLELPELFQVWALRLCGGKVPVPRCRWDNARRCGVACS